MDIIFLLASDQSTVNLKRVPFDVEQEYSEFVGTDVNAGDDEGRTPLMYAAHKGHLSIVKFLLQYGANIDIKYEKTGATPLELAIFKGIRDIRIHLRIEIISLLKSEFDELNLKNDI